MLKDFNISVLYQGRVEIEDMKSLPSLQPFSEKVCEFLSELSSALFKDKEAKQYPDVISLAFFCRKANLQKLKENYTQLENRLGRGLTYHIAPSNVPINFAYSLVAGLLAGNACIVRASSKNFIQTEIICRIMKKILYNSMSSINDYIMIITYERNKEITDYLSSLCDVRIIWGGDNTIREIRNSTIPSRSFDVTFADRYSICVLDACNVLEIKDMQKVAQDFYNDTYLNDQNACTSPRLMYWLGNSDCCKQAKEKFWNSIYDFIKLKYHLEPVIAVDKLITSYKCAIELENVHLVNTQNNLINRIEVEDINVSLSEFSCAGGSFIEYESNNLDDLSRVITKKFQTMSYLGCDPNELYKWVLEQGLNGFDRVVSMGKTLDFALNWDGYDLILTLSRVINNY